MITDIDIFEAATNFRRLVGRAEFDRWLDAHDQGIRDAVKPPKMTAREHLKAAREAACPVPEGRKIPANTGYLSWRNGECVGVYSEGVSYETPGREGDLERRTLEPLPPLIPEGTPAVWASTKDCDVRRVLALACNRSIPADRRIWRDGDGDTYRDAELIDPVPITEEER